MNKTIELVNLWGAYEEKNPKGTIEEFCRHYLGRRQKKNAPGTLVGGVVPPANDALLLKIIGRISKLNMSFANMALKGTGLNQIEEFGILQTIRQEKNPKKTETIYANLFELSSGTDMLTRMIKRGLIKEYEDTEDKRSKRIELTARGHKVVEESKTRIMRNARMIMDDLSEDDKALCIQLLKNVEIRFSSLWQKYRGQPFEDLYKEAMGKAAGKKES